MLSRSKREKKPTHWITRKSRGYTAVVVNLPKTALTHGDHEKSPSSAARTAWPTDAVVACPPRSGVRGAGRDKTWRIAARIRSAAWGRFMWSSIMATERIAASGLAMPLAGDIRRRSVNRLEHAGGGSVRVQVRGSCQPHASLKHSTKIRDDVAKHVGRQNHVESLRVKTMPHAASIHVLIVAFDLGIVT